MNTLLAAVWLSYTLGPAPVVLFDGRVPERGWEICSTGGVAETFNVTDYSLTATPK